MITYLKNSVSSFLRRFGVEIHFFPNHNDVYGRFLDFIDYVDPNFKNSLVRIGGPGDGGYFLTTELIKNIQVCMSPGIGESLNFDLELASKGIKIHLADGNIRRLPQQIPKHLENYINVIRKNVGFENTENVMDFNDWILDCTESGDSIGIQMDIEGFEHGIIPELSEENLRSIQFIILEFHGFHRLMRGDYIGDVHRKTWSYLENNFDLVYSKANLRGGSTCIGNRKVPNAVETLWRKRSIS